jgi:histidyl-tRNA synthetase
MKFKCPKGTRDFYPEEMAIRNWIVDRWVRVSRRNGFAEYDGPIFESLDLYRVKSGDGIVSELFHFEDRGGRAFAIRPEMTPTLARMVAARANALPRPIKWFSKPRLCRAERPQRGRLREFFQWNIDILGDDSPVSDAECIFALYDFLCEVGLTGEHFVIRINSRELVACILENAEIPLERFDAIYAVLDKRDKIGPDAFAQVVADLELTDPQKATLLELGKAKGESGLATVKAMLADHEKGRAELDRLERLLLHLSSMGVAHCCGFDMGVVRGLAYYTGIVFEAFGKGGLQRAICGGGRYDRLIRDVGGPQMSAVGFATSDVVVQDLLDEFDLLPELQTSVDVFVVDAEEKFFDEALALTARLRREGFSAEFSYKRRNMGKQFAQAAAKGSRVAVIVDENTRTDGTIEVKDMSTGQQRRVDVEVFLNDPFPTTDR